MKLVAGALGEQPLLATHMTFGHNSVTYDVTLPERSVIVRTNENGGVFAQTEHNLRLLGELGLPVPQVLASDLTGTDVPFAYMILNKIPGRDLRYELAGMTRGQMTRLAEQIVAFQRRVATLPQGTGYGYVAIGERGPHNSWWEVIRLDRFDSATEQTEDTIDRLESRLRRQVDRYEPYFRQAPPTCFLDDVTVKNVIVQAGVLQGLVDFDCVCYGDPLWWMSLTAVGVVSDVGTAELFYVDELARLRELTDLEYEILALYCAMHAVWFVRKFAADETPEWNRRMLTEIERWLRILA